MNLLSEVKEKNQDYEWYPTTEEILMCVSGHMINKIDYHARDYSILDIGAGNGSSLTHFKESLKDKIYVDLFAVEKSQILVNSMPENIFVIGTEFHEQTFIDKKHSVYFCNPPYSEYELWAEKLIKESNCESMYIVIPERWERNNVIKAALKSRDVEAKVIGNFSFEDSEYRKARAKVDVVYIRYGRGYTRSKVDPFDLWFDSHFSISSEKSVIIERLDFKKKDELVSKKDLIPHLVSLYKSEFENMLNNYKAVEKLDSSLLRELNVSVDGIKSGLKKKIEGLKSIYWKRLFDNLEALTNRLTTRSRDRMLEKLSQNTSVDFTESNIYSVVIWALKNANKYFDDQLIQVYWEMTRSENVVNYKSNKRIVEDGWRFSRDEMSHYKLDYRIIDVCYQAVTSEYQFDQTNGLKNTVHNKISDIFTIAKNLGFNISEKSTEKEWSAGKKNEFFLENGELFAEIKAFKNGNIHLKLNQRFMRMWNVEAGRLNGWIKSPESAAEELGIDIREVNTMFGKSLKLTTNDIILIEGE
jgi:hypothetical protein